MRVCFMVLLLFCWYGTIQAAEKVDFGTEIWPIFEARCIKCHQAPYKTARGRTKRPKAGLRLDTASHIMKGSKEGPVVIPGKPDESSLYGLLTLPADDLDIMPQEGDPLTKVQITLIRNWIKQGADFGQWSGEPTGDLTGVALLDQLAKDVPPPPEEALAALSEMGALIERIATDRHLLCVDLSRSANLIEDEQLAKLSLLTQHIISVDLAHTAISETGLKQIAAMGKLMCLHLGATRVGDAGLVHLKELAHLSFLNLYSTGVTDAGLEHLKQIKTLKTIVLWRTKVTDKGVNALKVVLPELEVVRDRELAMQFDNRWCSPTVKTDPEQKSSESKPATKMSHVCVTQDAAAKNEIKSKQE